MATIDLEVRRNRIGVSAAGTLSILLVWHLITDVFDLFVDVVLPSPRAIVLRVIDVWGLIQENLVSTLVTSAVGFTIAVLFGTAIAIVLVANDSLRTSLMPVIVAGNSVPRVALAPIIIFYIGGFQSKYVIAAWIAFFPMLINAMEGLGALDDDFENLLDSVGATTWQEFKWARFPNAIPFLFDGMKISVTLSIVGAVVAEFVAADAGIGWLALFALRNLDIPLMWGLVIVVGFATVIVFYTMFLVQNHIVHWKDTSLFAS